jgi:hypothetical protein
VGGPRSIFKCAIRAQSVIDVYWSVSQMIAVVETEEFLADVKGVLSEDEHDALILYVAQYPAAFESCAGRRKERENGLVRE